MNYNETITYIHSLGQFSQKASLERIYAVLEKLSNPQNNFKAIHIAGTNGKGSVSAMLSNAFIKAGYKTGLFISPYIINFRERIQINGSYISEDELVKLSQIVINTNIALTEFEFITAVGFLFFSQSKCDIAIVETGLGGRLDATNALENVAVSVITKIGLDHTAILGDTIEKIAAEKCGIIKNNVSVTSPCQNKNAMAVIQKSSDKLIIPDLRKLKILNCDINGNSFIYNNKKYDMQLIGKHQIENALVVIETIENSGYNICYIYIYEAINNTIFPARLEIINKSPLVILDGAHNPDGAKVLSDFMKQYNGRITAIIGMMKDKNYDEVLSITLPSCSDVIAVTVKESPRSLDKQDLKNDAEKYCKNAFTASDYLKAIEKAEEIAKGNPIFVFGSLYLASGIRDTLIKYFKI